MSRRHCATIAASGAAAAAAELLCTVLLQPDFWQASLLLSELKCDCQYYHHHRLPMDCCCELSKLRPVPLRDSASAIIVMAACRVSSAAVATTKLATL